MQMENINFVWSPGRSDAETSTLSEVQAVLTKRETKNMFH